jgi:tetratricopeptide (TPR) repeat protein
MAKQRGKKSSKGKSSAGHAGAKKKASVSQSGRIFHEAELHKKAGKLYEAEQAYRAVLALNPNHCPSLAQLAYMAINAARLPIALNYAKKAVEADHGDPQSHLVLATVLANLGLVDLAESELMIALQLDKENSHILNSLGNVYAQQGRFDEAIDTFRQAIAI